MAAATDLDEEPLYRHIEALLDAAEHQDNPLRTPLEQLYIFSKKQHARLERLIHISDGYHQIGRQCSKSLTDQGDRQLRRLEKLARISDLYQVNLQELTESLRQASLQDALTGLGNRRFLMDHLKQESQRADRKQSSFALAILDADHFKSVNDNFGHDIGDQLLCAIANTMKNGLREYDHCGRWGGEEFLVLFPDTDLKEAIQIADRLRLAMTQIELFEDELDPHPRVSVSIGLTSYRPGEDHSETIKRADDALLSAKRAGRNRLQVG